MPPAARKTAARSPRPTGNTTTSDKPDSGWKLGQLAPSDQYAPVGADGQPDLKKVSSSPVKGYGVQLAVKGQPVDRTTLIGLGKLDPTGGVDLVRTAAPAPQGDGQTKNA
jgi:hypothetical protein